MAFAKLNTAKSFLVGPILDADGVAKTDEVVASIKVTKNGADDTRDAQSTLTHSHTGHYIYAADVDDFDELGEVVFSLNSGTNAMAPVAFTVLADELNTTLAAILADTGELQTNQGAWATATGFATPTNITAAAGITLADGAITAAKIAASALNDKGNWNVGKTGYALTTAPLDAAGIRTAVGMADADLDTQLATLSTYDGSDTAGTTEILTRLPDAVPGEAGGVFIAGTNAATAVTTALTANVVGNITGNLSGSVGTLTGHTVQSGDSYAVVADATYGNAKLVRSTTPANTLTVSAEGVAKADVTAILTTTLTQSAGSLAAGFKKFFDVVTPVFTMSSVNQTGNNYPIVSHVDSGNAALLARGNSAWITATGFATSGALTTVDGIVDDIKAVTVKIDTALVVDGEVYQFTENALALGPGGGTGLSAQETRDAMKLAPSAGDPAAGSIDDHLDDMPADVVTAIEAYLAAAAAGAYVVTVTVTDGVDPLENAVVRLAEGVTTKLALTNALGVATFAADAATYARTITKAGYDFTPDTIEVTVAANFDAEMSATAITPSQAPQITVYATVCNAQGTALAGKTLVFRVANAGTGTGSAVDSAGVSATSDADGLISLTLLRSTRYAVSSSGRPVMEFVTDDDTTQALPNVII